MSVPILTNLNQFKTTERQENEFGETPLPYAPTVPLSDGSHAVPQQFLDVRRDLANLEHVLAQLTLPQPYQVFAGANEGELYLLVAIVGKENYPRPQTDKQQEKIVYGRRWLIEPTTPTSEIVQTVLLAVKKVREHELREKLKLRISTPNVCATPFNSHLDLPLMAGHVQSLKACRHASIDQQLGIIDVDGMRCQLVSQSKAGDQLVITVSLQGQSEQFEDLAAQPLVVVCNTQHEFLHAFMQALINRSDRFLDEQLQFQDFARFSWQHSVAKLAEFSYTTRNIQAQDPRFNTAFKDMSYKVDAAKAPCLNAGKLGQQQRAFLAQFDNLGGYLPKSSS